MSGKYITLNDPLFDYLQNHLHPGPDGVLRDLIQETGKLGEVSRMQISPDQGALLTMLVKISGAREIVEVGTFTGYSSVCLARGLSPGGRMVCFDRSGEWTAVARRAWERAGLTDRIELVLGDATETLPGRLQSLRPDLVFIDADKLNYGRYFEWLLPRMPSGGLVLFDNMLWSGRVADPKDQDDHTRAIRDLNLRLSRDPRVESMLLSIGDGIHVCRKV